MLERPVIVDTGPLVAFLVERESRHEWAVEQFKSLPAPFLTCEPVLAETFHLLSRANNGAKGFFDLLSSGLVVVDFALTANTNSLEKLIRKYRDLPMSLADACLVRMAEDHSKSILLTLDHHFKVYRKHGNQPIKIATPPD